MVRSFSRAQRLFVTAVAITIVLAFLDHDDGDDNQHDEAEGTARNPCNEPDREVIPPAPSRVLTSFPGRRT